MEIVRFSTPGNVNDLDGDALLLSRWDDRMSANFATGVESVKAYLNAHGGGTCQFYNPKTHGRSRPDLPLSKGDIVWNAFPKRYGALGPGQPAQYASIDRPVSPGRARDQDEYLEWFVERDAAQRIVSVQFTCEAWDYMDFLATSTAAGRAKLLELYRTWISPQVQEADLFQHGAYNRLNKWNTQHGALHLTHRANNLFAEVFLAATATVRRKNANGTELTESVPLTQCAGFGNHLRNSDPAIGAAVNGFARDGRMITLADPVGLYMKSFDGTKLTIDGQPAGGFFSVVRGSLPFGLRAIYRLPQQLAALGKTVSDVKIGGNPLQYGGQLAELITMHLIGVASKDRDVANSPIQECSAVDQVSLEAPMAAAFGLKEHFTAQLPKRTAVESPE